VIRTRSKAIRRHRRLDTHPRGLLYGRAYLLSRSTLQMYGFPVFAGFAHRHRDRSSDVSYVGCAIHDSGLLISGTANQAPGAAFLCQLTNALYTVAMLTVNLFLAAATTFLTAAAIVSVCGMRRSVVLQGPCSGVAFEFAVDLTLIRNFSPCSFIPSPAESGRRFCYLARMPR